MAAPNGRADRREIYRALVVDEFSDVTWSDYLRAGSRADDGRRPSQPRATTDGGQLLDADALPALHVGDHVTDRDGDSDRRLVVVGRPPETADEYDVNGDTVADLNPEYPATDDVLEAVYAQRSDVDLDQQTYAFPRSRLRLAAALHDRDDGDERGA